MKLRYTIIHEVDTSLLCDPDTLKEDFNNSWQKFMEWFMREEPALEKDALEEEAVRTVENRNRQILHEILSNDVDSELDHSDIEEAFVNALSPPESKEGIDA